MTTIATTFSRHIRMPRPAYRTFSMPNHVKQFRYFIEHSDWDDKILAYEARVNKICVGIIIASVLFFVPTLVKVCLR